jgi:CO/xanthine dehydrogenase Mo-binding subunit
MKDRTAKSQALASPSCCAVGSLRLEAAVVRKDGDVDATLAKAAKRVEAEYAAPYLAHATMGPMNCTAHVTPDKVEVRSRTMSIRQC